MICQLFKELNQAYRQLYEDPVISSCLFRSLDEFEQQLIFRFITEGGEIKSKEMDRMINQNNQEAKRLCKQAIDKFEQLDIVKYQNEQKSYKLSNKFSLSLENFIYTFKPQTPAPILLTETQQSTLNSHQPLLNLLYEYTLRDLLSYCNLSYMNLNSPEGALTQRNFNFIKATNAQRIGILVRGYLKYKNNPRILKSILYLSLLNPNQIYQIDGKYEEIIVEFQKLRFVKRIRHKYFAISKQLHHFAFQEKVGDSSGDLKCKIIIQTNFKVYVEVKFKDARTYSIIKCIMNDLLVLQHAEYDFEQLIVGEIKKQKMESLFQKNITADQYFQFFKQYMDPQLNVEKDLGKWKKLKFLGLQGPNSETQIPNNIKQQVKLWEKLKKQPQNYQIDPMSADQYDD